MPLSQHDINLLKGVREGDADLVRLALAGGANPDSAEGVSQRTALILAVITPMPKDVRQEIIEALFKAHASPDLADADGFTALHRAAGKNDLQSAEQLLDNHADPNVKSKKGGFYPLHNAVFRAVTSVGSKEMIALLLRHGADKSLADDALRTPWEIVEGYRGGRLVTDFALVFAGGAASAPSPAVLAPLPEVHDVVLFQKRRDAIHASAPRFKFRAG